MPGVRVLDFKHEPVIGRSLHRDPLGVSGGVNLYGYVGSNPTSRVDPSGLIGDWGAMGGHGSNGQTYRGGSLYGGPHLVCPRARKSKLSHRSWSYADEKRFIQRFQRAAETFALGVCGILQPHLGVGMLVARSLDLPISPYRWPDSWFTYGTPSPPRTRPRWSSRYPHLTEGQVDQLDELRNLPHVR